MDITTHDFEFLFPVLWGVYPGVELLGCVVILCKGVCSLRRGVPRWHSGKRICLPMQEMRVQSLGQEDPLEEEMATHSRVLSWRIPWTEEPGGLQAPHQSLALQRIGHV